MNSTSKNAEILTFCGFFSIILPIYSWNTSAHFSLSFFLRDFIVFATENIRGIINYSSIEIIHNRNDHLLLNRIN